MKTLREKDGWNFHHLSTSRYLHLVQTQVPTDVDSQDAVVLVRILQTHTHTRFRLARNCDKFWNDIIRCCDPIGGKITQLSLFGFDNNACRTPLFFSHGNTNYPSRVPTLLSSLNKLERLELRDCRSLPVVDFPAMKSLKWLNLSILDTNQSNNGNNFLIPDNRDWYPPNLKTFLIYGYKVKGDPLDALIAASIVMRSPPIELDDYNVHTSIRSSFNTNLCAENDIRDILLSDGIGPFAKFDERSGRLSELRLSSVVPNAFFQRSVGVDLPSNIGRLEMLKKLYLYNVCSVPKELSNLVHLRVLRLDGCSAFSDHPPNLKLPSVLDMQLRSCANRSALRWIVSSFPSLRSLEILNVDKNSLKNVFQILGESNEPSISFRNSLVKLHLSAAIQNTFVQPNPFCTFSSILNNHPNLSKLYVERVAGIRTENTIEIRIHSELLMRSILDSYPRVRGLSIGGPNIFTFDNRQHRRRRLGNGSLAVAKRQTIDVESCDRSLNLNRCGRVLLNQNSPVSCRWIPVSLWSRVLERAQKIPYAGTVQFKKDRKIQEVNALYFLLRNGPSLALREQFGFEFVRRNGAAMIISCAAATVATEDCRHEEPKNTRRATTRKRKRS